MNDQAGTLRKIMNDVPVSESGRVVLFLSGEVGSGKTSLMTLLSHHLESLGSRVLKLVNRRPISSEAQKSDFIFIEVNLKNRDCLKTLHIQSDEVLIILTPSPKDIYEAYSLIKYLALNIKINRISVVVNQVTDAREALDVFRKFNEVASRFIGAQLYYFGHLIKDKNIHQAMLKRKNLVELNSGASSTACLEFIAKRLKLIHSGFEERLEDEVNAWV